MRQTDPVIDEPPIAGQLFRIADPQPRPNLETAQDSDEGYSWIAACLWLSGSCTILVLAAFMSVGPERRVFLPGVSVPMPETCMMHARFGLDCPGCGLTRAFIHLAHGRILEGLSLNPAGIAIFLFVAAQIPAAGLRFLSGRSSRFAILWSRCNEIALIILPTLTFIQWIVRLSLGGYW
jgi:Protein of unknown function (DUF2752)